MNPFVIVRTWFQDPAYRSVVATSAIASAALLAGVFALAGH